MLENLLPRNSENKPFLKWHTHDYAWRQGQIIHVFFPLEDFASTPAILAQVWVLFVWQTDIRLLTDDQVHN